MVDAFPFSMVEATVWMGLACALGFLGAASLGKWRVLRKRPVVFYPLAAGPLVLLAMALGQGAFPLSLAPSAWRRPLAREFPAPPLPYPAFHHDLVLREERLLRAFSPEAYVSLGEREILSGCDRRLDTVLSALRLAPGRSVSAIKPMGPLTTLLGLSYGGPAFHDPFYGELAMVRPGDHPAPRYWRLIGICHETAHAKGFTREMDAEILTQLALQGSADARYRLLGDIMWLRKTGERVHYPAYLKREMLASRDSLERVERRQPAVRFLRSLSRKLGFQNSGGKYGSRESAEAWDTRHPFFATIAALAPRTGGGDGP